MPLGYALPFGLRDVKLQSISAAGAISPTLVDLPVARTLSFSDTEDVEELRGDDVIIASHGSGVVCEWDLEGGGISLEAYAIMSGGVVTSTGVSPNQTKSYRKLGTDARPYFVITGQAINDNGGDTLGIIFRAKADGALEGSFGDNSFWVTSASGRGYPDLTTGRVYDFVQRETSSAIVAVT